MLSPISSPEQLMIDKGFENTVYTCTNYWFSKNQCTVVKASEICDFGPIIINPVMIHGETNTESNTKKKLKSNLKNN